MLTFITAGTPTSVSTCTTSSIEYLLYPSWADLHSTDAGFQRWSSLLYGAMDGYGYNTYTPGSQGYGGGELGQPGLRHHLLVATPIKICTGGDVYGLAH